VLSLLICIAQANDWKSLEATIRALSTAARQLCTYRWRSRIAARSAMPFIVEDEITIVGMFWQNGFQTIQIGIPVDIVFDNAPGLKLPPN